MITSMCKNAKRIDFVFDCYLERQRQMSKIHIVVALSDITNDTRLPKDMDSFWPSFET